MAMALSFIVLFGWSALVAKRHPIANKEVTKENSPVISTPASTKETALLAKDGPSVSSLPSDFTITTDTFGLAFIEKLAAIKSVTFKRYQDYVLPLDCGLCLNDENIEFKKELITSNSVSFVHKDQNKKITKRFSFENDSYLIKLEVNIQNLSNLPLKIDTSINLGDLSFVGNNRQSTFQDAVISTKEKSTHLNARKNATLTDIKFVSLRDKYFAAIMEPDSENFTGFIKVINNQKSQVGVIPSEMSILANQQIGHFYRIYLGPQDLKIIGALSSNWTGIINYGTFDFISQILLQLLEFLYKIVHNWGWAIVVLSLLVYLILYPLTIKQMRSMKEMQLLQPKIEALRVMHKDNPQRLNKEIMELYRTHKVNPFGGCLPLILQMPIFFALYQALMRSIALKGASFLWIKDLSEPDRLFTLPAQLPIIGNEINILPIIMAIGMFVQQKISASNTSSVSSEQQKIMLIVFPLMFGFIFYRMPAGLVLYWFINSTLTLVYQLKIARTR